MEQTTDGREVFAWFVSPSPTGGWRAIAYTWTDDAWLYLYAFDRTHRGLYELVAYRIEHLPQMAIEGLGAVAPADDPAQPAFMMYAQHVCASWLVPVASAGLTSRQVRAASEGPLMSEAVRALPRVLAAVGVAPGQDVSPVRPVAGRRTDQQHYAAVAVEYERLLAEVGRGARLELARRHRVEDSVARNWIQRAKALGFWVPAGPGRTGGYATKLAHETAEEA